MHGTEVMKRGVTGIYFLPSPNSFLLSFISLFLCFLCSSDLLLSLSGHLILSFPSLLPFHLS